MAHIEESSSRIPFLVNFIVTRINVYKVGDPKSAVVDVNFNNVNIKITPSRINVNEFNPNRAIVVMQTPKDLRNKLESAGPSVSVKYKGGAVGTGEFTFPQTVIDRIDKGMSDILHSDTVHIDSRGVDMGTLELLCFLTVKCEETEELEGSNRCANLGQSIKPSDVMFVVGAPQPSQAVCETCEDELVPERGDELLTLDLSRYSRPNQRATTPPISSLTACSNLRAITNEYGDIIDSFMEKVKNMPTTIVNNRILNEDVSNKSKYEPEYIDRSIRAPLGDMEHLGIRPIRFCPVCLTSLSHMPKYAGCPNCHNKAVPDIEPVARDSLTADQIIDEIIKPDGKQSSAEDQTKSEAHCCCKSDDVCPRCRIRNMYAELCDPIRQVKEKCPVVKPRENEDFRVLIHPKSPQNSCSPYLEQVLDELRYLYKQRDENMLANPPNHFNRFSVGLDNIDKLTRQSAGTKPVGYPTSMQRMSDTQKVGHKTCAGRAAAVPRRHGWAWPSTKAAKYGWRPGAVSRNMGIIMRFFLNIPKRNEIGTFENMEEDPNEEQPVILNISKKKGAIYLTLNAVRSPNIETKPVVFKIVKSDLAVALSEIKKQLKSMGFRKCVCHNSVMECVCRATLEKKYLESALQEECEHRKMVSCVDQLVLTDTTESEMEYNLDVTPPIPDPKPRLAIKPCTKCMATQTDPDDLKPRPRDPASLDPYWRAYKCASGYRKRLADALESKKANGKQPKGKSGPIPVRMQKRYYENLKKAAQSEKEAMAAKIAKKKKGINLVKYLMKDGTVSPPWDPNNPNPKIKPKVKSKPRPNQF